MSPKFINVFKKEYRDKLIAMGFQILKDDDKSSVYTFYANEDIDDIKLDFEGIPFVTSDVLTF